MWWELGAVAAVILLAAYVAWTAHRVERVHVRAQSAARALDAHLLRRSAAAAVVAEHTDFIELYAAARLALDAADDEREAAENDLTRQLRAMPLIASASASASASDEATRALAATSRRVALARQVHTDLVRDALTARRRPLVRLLGLARRYERPSYFEIVDPTLPVTVAPRPAVDDAPDLAVPTA